MSTFPSGLTGCPDLQLELTNYFRNCTENGIFVEPMPAYEFLMSPLNRQGITPLQSALNPGPGKLRTVQLRYSQRLSEAVVENNTDCAFTCTSTNKLGDGVAQYELDPCDKIEYSVAMDANDFRAACRSNPEIVMEWIMQVMDVVVRRTATERTNDMAQLYGNWSTNVAAAGLTVAGDSLRVQTRIGGLINPLAQADIDAAFTYSNYCMRPVLMGGATLDRYYRALNVGCCQSTGLNLGEVLAKYGMAWMYDQRLQTALAGPDHAMSVMPGALQIVFYNTYAGQNAINDAAGLTVGRNYDTGVLIHPRTGTPVNVLLSDNCGVLSIVAHTVSKVFAMPNDMFPAGDTMEGVNFVNLIDVFGNT